MFSISILIRNRNEGEDLRLVLQRLREQHAEILEIVVVDNDSTDESRRYIQEFDCKLIHLPAGEFTYGRATNLGFQNCSGDLVVTLSSHSLPIGRYFLHEVTAPFVAPNVAAARIPIASNTAELRNFSSFEPLDRNSSAEEVFRRGPVASGSVVRRSIWLEHRFDESLGAAEDKDWALRVLRSADYVMPVVNSAYCYTRPFPPKVLIRRRMLEEASGMKAANILPRASLRDALFSVLVAQRDVFRKARVEAQLYWFRSRLSRLNTDS
jgi:glycosyltransferase involved in cell wall biosynthesis